MKEVIVVQIRTRLFLNGLQCYHYTINLEQVLSETGVQCRQQKGGEREGQMNKWTSQYGKEVVINRWMDGVTGGRSDKEAEFLYINISVGIFIMTDGCTLGWMFLQQTGNVGLRHGHRAKQDGRTGWSSGTTADDTTAGFRDAASCSLAETDRRFREGHALWARQCTLAWRQNYGQGRLATPGRGMTSIDTAGR
jgi:hypothetical protein